MASKKVGCFMASGKPHGKERVQFNSNTKKAYTPRGQIKAEEVIYAAYYAAGYHKYDFDGLCRVEVTACYALPKDMSKEEQGALIGTPAYNGSLAEKGRKEWEYAHLKKGDKKYGPLPDIDNVIKTVLDALNEVAYKDDTQVVQVWGRSVYGPKDCTQVRITVLGPKDTTGGDQDDA